MTATSPHHLCPTPLLLPSSPPSTSPQPLWPEGAVITGAVDSVALGFGSLLYWADSLIKHANRIYRTRLNNHSLCSCYVVSDGLSLCLRLFFFFFYKNLIIRYQLVWTCCSTSRWIIFNISLIDFGAAAVYVQQCWSILKGHTSNLVIIPFTLTYLVKFCSDFLRWFHFCLHAWSIIQVISEVCILFNV